MKITEFIASLQSQCDIFKKKSLKQSEEVYKIEFPIDSVSVKVILEKIHYPTNNPNILLFCGQRAKVHITPEKDARIVAVCDAVFKQQATQGNSPFFRDVIFT